MIRPLAGTPVLQGRKPVVSRILRDLLRINPESPVHRRLLPCFATDALVAHGYQNALDPLFDIPEPGRDPLPQMGRLPPDFAEHPVQSPASFGKVFGLSLC